LDTLGLHLLAEYHGCDRKILDDEESIALALHRAAEHAGATVVSKTFHRFAPQGVSGVVVIEESHLSIHTWPEKGYAAVDFYTCGECDPESAARFLRESLSAERIEVLAVRRGLDFRRESESSLKIRRHFSECLSNDEAGLVHRDV
jgi:S-adenosylmethionine decarboxylase proenzyme